MKAEENQKLIKFLEAEIKHHLPPGHWGSVKNFLGAMVEKGDTRGDAWLKNKISDIIFNGMTAPRVLEDGYSVSADKCADKILNLCYEKRVKQLED